MRALELFSGTGSVGNALQSMGYDVVSVDISDKFHKPTHIANILEWDYSIYPSGHFDIIWASPPCETFSKCRNCWIGRKNRFFGDDIITKEMLVADETKRGLPLLRRAQQIIQYFAPRRWIIENPAGGRMKNYIPEAPFIVDYCKYADFGYKKPTAIWTNKTDFVPLRCHLDCPSIIEWEGRRLHKLQLGGVMYIEEDGKKVIVNTAEMRERYRGVDKLKPQGIDLRINDKYRVPAKLIADLAH
jgi:hypothetical protein